MAVSRVTPRGWLQETGSKVRVTPRGWVQETIQTVVTLTTADATNAQAADNVSLTQNYALSINAATNAQTVESLLLTAVGAQNSYPNNDISFGNWIAIPTGSYYATVDETSPDDNDYSHTFSSGATLELALETLYDPQISVNHVLTYRGIGAYTVSLRQGTSTEIASWVEDDDVETTHKRTLTTGEADSITDYSDLRVRVVSG